MNLLLRVLVALALPGGVCAQATAPAGREAPPERRVTLTIGGGNAMGWFGAQAERYFAHARRSVFLGLGYTPSLDGDDTAGPAVAAGARGYTGGQRHRAFVELSVSQISVSTSGSHYYGPGLQLGYQYTARHGFTVMASAGLGYALSQPASVVGSHVQALGGLGVGYTWR